MSVSAQEAAGLAGAAAAAPAALVDDLTLAERARAAAASAMERAECEARFAAACAAAEASGAPAPFRGPAADSEVGERFLDIAGLLSASGFALDARPTRYLCGLTFRLGARRADGSLDRGGFLGGTADMIENSLRLQAPWLEAARRAPRRGAMLQGRWYPEMVERTTSLIRAAFAGDERRVRELLAAGAPLRCVDSRNSRTALLWASIPGDARVVAALLEADAAGETVDARDCVGNTALIWSSDRGHTGTVRLLLARGARQELQSDRSGNTALHKAAECGFASVVELLCAAPGAAAALALRDKNGRTPLARAVSWRRDDCAAVLRAHGATS